MSKPRLKQLLQMRLPPLPTIRDILRLYKLRALRQLSQNFLLDLRLTDKIVRSAGVIRGGEVMEVGPGPGAITRSILARNPSKLILVEKDPRFLPVLEMLGEAALCPVKVFKGDILTFNMSEMFNPEFRREWGERPPNIHLIGNLPFQVSTRLIILWLQDISERRNAWSYGRVGMTLTFQHEVAERMVAPILHPQRCRLSVMCQNWCRVQYKFSIPGKAFLPKPEVDVGVVYLEPVETPVIDLPFKLVEKVVRCIFSYRQKYCIRGVETLFPRGVREEIVPALLEKAEVDPTSRPYQLTLPEIGRICFAYHDVIQKHPRYARYNSRQAKNEKDEDVDEEDEDADYYDEDLVDTEEKQGIRGL